MTEKIMKSSSMPLADSLSTEMCIRDSTRVGQITDYDKLTLDVWTNGVINAQEAVSLAAKVLTEDVYKRQTRSRRGCYRHRKGKTFTG